MLQLLSNKSIVSRYLLLSNNTSGRIIKLNALLFLNNNSYIIHFFKVMIFYKFKLSFVLVQSKLLEYFSKNDGQQHHISKINTFKLTIY